MKHGVKLFFIGIIVSIILLSECTKEPSRISIMFTAMRYPQIVKHGGYYLLLSTGDSVTINGYTPSEYIVSLEAEDTLFLFFWKDTTSDDTLQIDLYVEGVPEIEKGWLFWPDIVVEYRYPPLGVE